jgi:hypothetical protein
MEERPRMHEWDELNIRAFVASSIPTENQLMIKQPRIHELINTIRPFVALSMPIKNDLRIKQPLAQA